MTHQLTAEVAREIDARAGDRVRAVHQDGPAAIRLDLRANDERIDLVVALDPALPRVHFARARKAPRAPSGLAGALRKPLAGARLAGAHSVEGERALCVRFTRAEGARTLWIELFGGQANWYLLDENGHVLWTLRGDVAARRDASQGALFVPVPARPVEDESDETRSEDALHGSAAVRELWKQARGARQDTSAAARLRKLLKAERSRAQKGQRTLAKALENEALAADLERKGELLRGAFHLLEPGLARVTVPDYTQDPPTEVVIELDAKLPPGEQIGACFKRAQRMHRTAADARARYGDVAERLEQLDAALQALAPEHDEDLDVARLLTRLPADLHAAVESAAQAPRAAAKPKGPTRAAAWRTFVSADGWDIHVGRDARANDELTLHKAKPGDLFLHVRGVSGSHVIVPTPRGKSVPGETLLDAAELACHFSTRRKAERNEVDYTPRRYVRKPKGSAPGLVVLERSKNAEGGRLKIAV
ncbi:MAG: NFACT RNA binding domain-containing protein, partial [Planctomycetota bacterium]|nr:NFACT RNA binding domain-containing protein [Planctomycetota bacterium]